MWSREDLDEGGGRWYWRVGLSIGEGNDIVNECIWISRTLSDDIMDTQHWSDTIVELIHLIPRLLKVWWHPVWLQLCEIKCTHEKKHTKL